MTFPIHPSTYDIAKYFEGCYLDAYKDPVGYWTQGWGHLLTLDKNAPKPPRIDQDTADRWLVGDMQQVAQRLCGGILEAPEALPVNKLGALVDFAFNLGTGALKSSTLLRKVNARAPDDEIIFQLGRWDKAGGMVLKGLKRRRAAEAMLWLSGGFDPAQLGDYISLFD